MRAYQPGEKNLVVTKFVNPADLRAGRYNSPKAEREFNLKEQLKRIKDKRNA